MDIIECLNCEYKGAGKAGRSLTVIFLCLIGGFFTLGVLWGFAIVYNVLTRDVICLRCESRNVIKK